MAKFRDGKDESWTIEISLQTVLDIKRECEVDLFTICDDGASLWQRLHTEVPLVMACVRVACADQIAERKLGETEFFKRIFGDAIETARDAFLEALHDFFPNPKTRATLREMETKARQLTAKLTELQSAKALKMIAEIDVDLEAQRLSDFVGSGAES